jgi:hypothetical protein
MSTKTGIAEHPTFISHVMRMGVSRGAGLIAAALALAAGTATANADVTAANAAGGFHRDILLRASSSEPDGRGYRRSASAGRFGFAPPRRRCRCCRLLCFRPLSPRTIYAGKRATVAIYFGAEAATDRRHRMTDGFRALSRVRQRPEKNWTQITFRLGNRSAIPLMTQFVR